MRTEQEEQESSVGPQQVVGYKLTFAENGRAPELAGSIWTRMAKCDDPIHSRREGRQSGPGADVNYFCAADYLRLQPFSLINKFIFRENTPISQIVCRLWDITISEKSWVPPKTNGVH